jgi:hypothetical protein
MMTSTEESHCPRYFFQERVGKTLLFSRLPVMRSSSEYYRKKFVNVCLPLSGYKVWTEFEWDRCLLLEVYEWPDERCDNAMLLSDQSFHMGYELAVKIYVDGGVVIAKVRTEDFTDLPGEDENV